MRKFMCCTPRHTHLSSGFGMCRDHTDNSEITMGLNCSHDAFDGAYSAFNRLRQAVCRALGPDASFPPHLVYGENNQPQTDARGMLRINYAASAKMFYVPDDCTSETAPGIWCFLTHSDCDGEISPEMCIKVADELEALLPGIDALGWTDGGHIGRAGGYGAAVRKFIAGCRCAAEAQEPLSFH